MNVTTESRPDFCQICDASVKKYRCPVCLIQYCTLVCFRAHKPSCALVKADPPAVKIGNVVDETSDEVDNLEQVPGRLLANFQHSEEIRRMLRDPRLQSVLKFIDSSDDRVAALEQMRLKEGAPFKEFLDMMLVTMEVTLKTPEGFVEFKGIPRI